MKRWVFGKGWFSFGAWLLFACAGFAAVPIQNPLDQWTFVHPRGLRFPLAPVAYGNGTYVVGMAGDTEGRDILISSNTISWERTSASGGGYTDILFAEGRFWAAGRELLSSADAIDWESHYRSYFLYELRYHAGTWLMGERQDELPQRLLISTNGRNWSILDWDVAPYVDSFEVKGGTWLAVDQYQRAYISSDARNWSATGSGPSTLFLQGLAANDEVFVAYGSGTYPYPVGGSFPDIAYSRDGVNWTSATAPAFPPYDGWHMQSVVWGHAGFVGLARCYSNPRVAVLTSADGITWEAHDFPVYTFLLAASYAGGLYFMTGDQGVLFTSRDGIRWTQRLGSSSRQIRGLTGGDSGLAAVGEGGLLLTSDDGRFWRHKDSVTHEDLWDVEFSRGRYVAVGGTQRPLILVSPTAALWQTYSSAGGGPLRSVTPDYNGFLAVGLDGTVARLRKNRAEFFQVAGEPDFRSVAKLGDIFIAVAHETGYGELMKPGTIYTSTNGVQWTPVLTHEAALTSVATGNDRAVVLGLKVVYISRDAVNWLKFPNSNDWTRLQVTYGSGVFLAGGGGKVYVSRNGIQWTGYPSSGYVPSVYPAPTIHPDPWFYAAVYPGTPWVAFGKDRVYTGIVAEYMWRSGPVPAPIR